MTPTYTAITFVLGMLFGVPLLVHLAMRWQSWLHRREHRQRERELGETVCDRCGARRGDPRGN